jgi:fructose-bisphosphate aldolase class II
MPLVSGLELLQHAQENRYAVGAFNADNMEVVQAVVEAAQESRSPVILQVSPPTIRYAGLGMAAAMAREAASQADVPVALHLDHGENIEQAVLCLRAGFTSLMYDGSRLPFEENVAQTLAIVQVAHAAGVQVEAELGKVLQAGATQDQVRTAMTDAVEAGEFARATGCDSLAVAVGSIHGMKHSGAVLDIERIETISQETDIPLVLHGGSGTSRESLQAAIHAGICKVNVGTFLKQGFTEAMRAALRELPDEIDFRRVLGPARNAVVKRVREWIVLLGSNDRLASNSGFQSSDAWQSKG